MAEIIPIDSFNFTSEFNEIQKGFFEGLNDSNNANVCRCCLSENCEKLFPVDKYSSILELLFTSQIPTDPALRWLCYRCVQTVKRLASFRDQCFRTERVLNEYYNKFSHMNKGALDIIKQGYSCSQSPTGISLSNTLCINICTKTSHIHVLSLLRHGVSRASNHAEDMITLPRSHLNERPDPTSKNIAEDGESYRDTFEENVAHEFGHPLVVGGSDPIRGVDNRKNSQVLDVHRKQDSLVERQTNLYNKDGVPYQGEYMNGFTCTYTCKLCKLPFGNPLALPAHHKFCRRQPAKGSTRGRTHGDGHHLQTQKKKCDKTSCDSPQAYSNDKETACFTFPLEVTAAPMYDILEQSTLENHDYNLMCNMPADPPVPTNKVKSKMQECLESNSCNIDVLSHSNLNSDMGQIDDASITLLHAPKSEFEGHEVVELGDMENKLGMECLVSNEGHHSMVNPKEYILVESDVQNTSRRHNIISVSDSSCQVTCDTDNVKSECVEIKDHSMKERQVYSCAKCRASFSTFLALRTHSALHRGFKCEICMYVFRTEDQLRQHSLTHQERIPPICHVCDKSFRKLSMLKKHNATVHSDARPFSCDKCGKSFKLENVLKLHMRVHSEQRQTLVCEQCGMSFNTPYSLKIHRIKHTGLRPHPCDECAKTFLTESSLKTHKIGHLGIKAFKCQECPAAFRNRFLLKQHVRLHTGERPFRCESCGKAFRTSDRYKIHARIHSGVRPFACADCGKRFTSCSHLKMHRRIHTGERPFPCSACPRTFLRKSDLLIHWRIHSGEKPYRCEVCGMSFTVNSSLKLHRRTHTGETFPCDLCSYRGLSASRVRLHRMTHTGEKPYACQMCSYRTTTASQLKKHARTHKKTAFY